jgi:hypothetical protein
MLLLRTIGGILCTNRALTVTLNLALTVSLRLTPIQYSVLRTQKTANDCPEGKMFLGLMADIANGRTIPQPASETELAQKWCKQQKRHWRARRGRGSNSATAPRGPSPGYARTPAK